jgi:hypothetical protein
MYILTALFLSYSFAYSEEFDSAKPMRKQYHRVSVGSDVFFYHDQGDVSHWDMSELYNVDYTANAVLGGLRLGYDYLKPKALYFGTDGLVAMGMKFIKSEWTHWAGYPTYLYTRNQQFQDTPLFANLEQRCGYTFQSPISPRSTLTPFIGIGWYYIRSQFNNGRIFANWFYGAAGYRAAYQFCEDLSVGFNLKAMYTFAKKGWRSLGAPDKNTWGYEVAMPFIWQVGASNTWDLQFQPYLLKLDVNNNSLIVGFRLQSGCSF